MPDDYKRVQEALVDADAFSALYRENVRAVYHYLLSRTGSHQDAEDLTAQTFIAALETLHRFQRDSNFQAWLIGIARHKYLDEVHRQKRMVPLSEQTWEQQDWIEPEAQVMWQADVKRLAAALKNLASDRAEALQLRVYAGLSAREVGHMMGKSEGAINTLVYRAMQDLKKWMNRDE